MKFAEFLLNPDIGAALIETAGSADFAPLLLATARDLGGVDEVFAYALSGTRQPTPLAIASLLDNAQQRADLYVQRFFHHDPLIHRHRQMKPDTGFGELVRIGEIAPSDYRSHCFISPGFAEKLSFGWRASDCLTVLSFYSRTQYAIIPDRLNALAGVALAALNRRTESENTGTLIAKIELRLMRKFPGLSVREKQILARLIVGEKPGDIAEALSITKESVLTYRKRSMQKTSAYCIRDLMHEVFY